MGRGLSLLLIFFVQISLSVTSQQSEEISEPRTSYSDFSFRDSFPVRLVSGFFDWVSGGIFGHESASNRVELQPGSATQTGQFKFSFVKPFQNLVSQASSMFSGLRERISTSVSSFTDYLVNGIPYALEATKLPNEHGPKYARGQTPSDFHTRKLYDASKREVNKKEFGPQEAAYEDFRRNTLKQEPFLRAAAKESKDTLYDANYDPFYSLRDTSRSQMQEYEQILENDVPRLSFEEHEPIEALMMLYRKLEEAFSERQVWPTDRVDNNGI